MMLYFSMPSTICLVGDAELPAEPGVLSGILISPDAARCRLTHSAYTHRNNTAFLAQGNVGNFFRHFFGHVAAKLLLPHCEWFKKCEYPAKSAT